MGRFGSWFRQLFSSEKKRHAVALAFVLVFAFGARVTYIVSSLPYCGHVDEDTWARIALRMVRTGDLNPHRFRKPSLPVYLMAAGFSAGLVQAKVTGKAERASDLGEVAEPYYQVPSAALPPKLLFALLSVLALGLAGYAGACLTGRRAMLWLTPLLASVSSTYLGLTWTYMTVDVPGTFFVWAALAYLAHLRVHGLFLTAGEGALRRLVTVAVLAGLAVGSKYNLFPIVLTGVLWLVLFERERWFKSSALLGAISVAAFFATTPFALVSPGEFVFGLQKEMHHYATGHGQVSLPRGFPMLLLQIRDLVDNFGVLPSLLALSGLVLAFRRDARLSLVLFSYAALFLGYMSLQRVFFERNLLALHLHVALALGVAVLELPGWLAGIVQARWSRFESSRVRTMARALVLLVLLAGLPWSRVAMAYENDSDSRIRVSDWLRRNLKHKPVVIVDPAIGLDARKFEKKARVTEADSGKNARRVRKSTEREDHVFVVCQAPNQAGYEAILGPLKERARFGPSLRTCDPTCPDLVVLAK